MGKHVTIRVAAEVVEVDGGLWCETCAALTAARVWIAVQVGSGPVELVDAFGCDECGEAI